MTIPSLVNNDEKVSYQLSFLTEQNSLELPFRLSSIHQDHFHQNIVHHFVKCHQRRRLLQHPK